MTELKAHPATRRRLVPALVLLLVLAAASGTSASSAETGASAPNSDLPQPDGATVAAIGISTSVRAAKAKLDIVLPGVTSTAYATLPYRRPPASGYVRAPRDFLPRRPSPACDYYLNDFPVDIYVDDIDQPDPAKRGTLRSVGTFPDVPVRLLAFGGLPVTAVLHTEQARRNGRVVPLTADGFAFPASVPKGTGDAGPTGCDRAWEANVVPFAAAHGEITARVSDVRVDGTPLDVGDDCRPVTALELNLSGVGAARGGPFKDIFSGGVLVQRKDTRVVNPANPIAVAPGSSDLTIPPFGNCVGKDGEDVSRLVTGLVSGPDNTVAVNLGGPIVFFDFDPVSYVTKCKDGVCVELPPHVNPLAPGK